MGHGSKKWTETGMPLCPSWGTACLMRSCTLHGCSYKCLTYLPWLQSWGRCAEGSCHHWADTEQPAFARPTLSKFSNTSSTQSPLDGMLQSPLLKELISQLSAGRCQWGTGLAVYLVDAGLFSDAGIGCPVWRVDGIYGLVWCPLATESSSSLDIGWNLVEGYFFTTFIIGLTCINGQNQQLANYARRPVWTERNKLISLKIQRVAQTVQNPLTMATVQCHGNSTVPW